MNNHLKICLIALGLAASMPANAGQLGRLFFTPEQRAQLEQDKPANTGSGDRHGALTVNGIVQKHGGARTVWINGLPEQAAGNDDRAPESLSVTISGTSQPVKIKVGQKMLINPATASGQ